jgi:hypothetical protein
MIKKNGVIMAIDNFETIKAYVLTLGDFTDSAKLDLQIEMIIDEVLAYCYRKDVPPCMELPLADVIVNELNQRGFSESALGFDGNITSYREGDMSINLGGSSSGSTSGASVKYNGKLEGFKQIIGAIRCSETTDAQ